MATGEVQLVGSQIGLAGASGHSYDKVFDGDFDTYYDSTTANGQWFGIDAGTACTVTRWRFAPRLGDSGISVQTEWESRNIGAKIQASSASDFTSDVTDCDTVPSPLPNYPARNFNERSTTSPPSKRYWRYLSATGGHANLAELRFIANAGPSSAKPVAPTISPWGGKYPTSSPTVTLASLTTSASLYYTVDGSTPTSGSTLYSAPFTLTLTTAAVTLKVIAIDGSLSTTDSDVVSAVFTPWAFAPNADWYDDRGILIEAHSGGILKGAGSAPLAVGGYYYWYGSNANKYYNSTGPIDGMGVTGIWVYKSTDLMNWVFVGNILDTTGAGQLVVRPHVVYNPNTSLYVLWAHAYTEGGGTNNAVIATSSNPDTGWTWSNTGFQPDGFIFRDGTLFRDDDNTGYIAYETFDSANGTIKISRLNSDYLDVDGTITSINTSSPYNEAPCLGKVGSLYVLIVATQNYYNSPANDFTPYVFTSSAVLSGWSARAQLTVASTNGTSFNGQATDFIAPANSDSLWFLGDYWGADLYNSRQVWLPFTVSSTTVIADAPPYWNPNYPANDFLNGLSIAYEFDELTNTNLTDSKNGHTATISGNVSISDVAVHFRARHFAVFADGLASLANTADVQTGDIDCTWEVWLWLDIIADFPIPFSKADQSTENEYAVYVDTSGSNNLVFQLSSNGSATTDLAASTFGALSTGTLYHVICWHDSVNNVMGVSVNGVENTASYSSGIRAGSAGFRLAGISNLSTGKMTGTLDMYRFWKGRVLDSTERTTLYNKGRGIPYTAFASSISSANAGVNYFTRFVGGM